MTSTRDGLLAQISQVYQSSRKKRDIFWNTYVARPAAAGLVWGLARTPITPNQVSFLGGVVFLGVAAILVGWSSPWAMLAAGLVLQASYVLDCADGQLARLTGMTSPVGAYLDFLIDEFKALILVGACCVRLWGQSDDPLWLLLGCGGIALVSVATSLTTFVRRPAYAGAEIKPGVQAARPVPKGIVGKVVWAIESVSKWLIHYPSWFLYIALVEALTPLNGALWFLVLFLGVYVLYTARTTLAVVRRLGSPHFYTKE